MEGYEVVFKKSDLEKPFQNIEFSLMDREWTEIGNSLEFDFVVPPPHS